MDAAIGAAFEELRRIEALLSPYQPASEFEVLGTRIRDVRFDFAEIRRQRREA